MFHQLHRQLFKNKIREYQPTPIKLFPTSHRALYAIAASAASPSVAIDSAIREKAASRIAPKAGRKARSLALYYARVEEGQGPGGGSPGVFSPGSICLQRITREYIYIYIYRTHACTHAQARKKLRRSVTEYDYICRQCARAFFFARARYMEAEGVRALRGISRMPGEVCVHSCLFLLGI